MKCPKCGGNAELSNWGSYTDPDFADFHVECEKCGYHSMGSTDLQKTKEMFANGIGMYYTNEQLLRRCNTEQLADKLTDFSFWLVPNYQTEDKREQIRKNIVDWLKQPHTTGW